MGTITDFLGNKVRETVNVDICDRSTAQVLKFKNINNEYWGTFRGSMENASGTKIELSSVVELVDTVHDIKDATSTLKTQSTAITVNQLDSFEYPIKVKNHCLNVIKDSAINFFVTFDDKKIGEIHKLKFTDDGELEGLTFKVFENNGLDCLKDVSYEFKKINGVFTKVETGVDDYMMTLEVRDDENPYTIVVESDSKSGEFVLRSLNEVSYDIELPISEDEETLQQIYILFEISDIPTGADGRKILYPINFSMANGGNATIYHHDVKNGRMFIGQDFNCIKLTELDSHNKFIVEDLNQTEFEFRTEFLKKAIDTIDKKIADLDVKMDRISKQLQYICRESLGIDIEEIPEDEVVEDQEAED